MRLLDRYLLRELLVPLGFCLCGFLIFWISFDLFSELGRYQELKLHFVDILQLYLVTIPEFLVLILPMTLLLALLYALTNHARNHELTAIRAAGVSLWRICVPYLIVGFVFSCVVFAINEFWVPNSSELGEQIKNSRLDKKVAAVVRDVQPGVGLKNSRDGRTWFIGSYNLKTKVMTEPQVNWILNDGTERLLTAKMADYTNGCWTFYDVIEHEYGATHAADRLMDLVQVGRLPDFILVTNMIAFPEFSETPDEFEREIRFSKRLVTHNAHSAEVPIADIFDYLKLHPHDLTSRNKWWLYTQLHGRLAAPWTCLIVVFIAIPFGAASGRRNVFVGVASSIVIAFAYFILLRLGLALGTGGYLPAWLAAWLPNLAFGAVGIWLMLRVR
jgi:lipopolysaccharide export system permease protein